MLEALALTVNDCALASKGFSLSCGLSCCGRLFTGLLLLQSARLSFLQHTCTLQCAVAVAGRLRLQLFLLYSFTVVQWGHVQKICALLTWGT